MASRGSRPTPTHGSRAASSGRCRRRCRSRTSTRCRPSWPAPTSTATPAPRRWRGSARSCRRWPETDMAIVSDIQTEPPPDRALFIGARLFVAADAFFFLGFLFAYLYLRALNSNGLWHPPHTNPSGALATVSLVAALWGGVQLFDPGFAPAHGGGYGAVFVGFTAGLTVHLLGAASWLATIA